MRPGDLLVLNDSRVIPARLYARRTLLRDHEKPTGRIEVMLLEPAGENQWRALVRPGRKVAIGERLVFPARIGEIVLEAEVLERGKFGERLLEFAPPRGNSSLTIFLPCWTRSATCRCRRTFTAMMRKRIASGTRRCLRSERGSVAAPTAGLHFTPQMLEALAGKGR